MPKINTGEPWEQNLRKKVRSISKLRKLKGFTISQTRGKAILRFKNPGEKRTIGRMLKGNWTEDNAENLLAEITDFIGSEECYLWASEKRMQFPLFCTSCGNVRSTSMTLSNFWQASEPNKLTAPEFNEALRIIQISKGLTSDLAVKLEKLRPQICKD